MVYLAQVNFEEDSNERMRYLGAWDNFEKAEKKVKIWLRAFEENSYGSAAGWVIEFEMNKHSLGKRTLIETV